MKSTVFLPCFLVFFFLLVFSKPVWAQASQPYSVGAQAYYGFILRHHPFIGALTVRHPVGGEVFYERIKTGQQFWEQAYHYPRVGWALGYYDLGSPQMGQMVYLINYLEKKLIQGRLGEMNFKIGWGAGYCDNPFNLETNFQNQVLSSRFNFALRGGIGYTVSFAENWKGKVGLSITHFSNGAFKMPNAGVNLVMAGLGLSYTPHAKNIVYHRDAPLPKPWRKWSVNLAGAFTIKEHGLPGGKKYPGAVLMAHLSRRLSYKSALNIGLDGTYNTAIRAEIDHDPTIDAQHRPDFKRVALALGHELYISSKVSLLTQVGVYVYKKYTSRVDAPIYQRYGLKYYLTDRLFGGMFLKSHYGTADFVEWTVGVNW